MRELVSWGGWPNGIDPPTAGDALEAAYRLLTPAPDDFRPTTERAEAMEVRTGLGGRLAIYRSAEVRDRSSYSSQPPSHILGIPIVVDPRLPDNAIVFTDRDGHVLHTIVLVDD